MACCAGGGYVGIVNLSLRCSAGIVRRRARPEPPGGSGGTGHAGNLAPRGESVVAMLAVGGDGQAVAARAAMADDPAIGGEEALRVPGRFEPPHLPLALARGLVRILRTVVQPLWRRGSTLGKLARLAASSLASLSVIGTRGTYWSRLSSRRKNFRAARLSRRLRTRMASMVPS